MLHHAKSGHALVGSCCWSVAHQSYPDYDGFTLYLGEGPSAAATASMPGAQASSAAHDSDESHVGTAAAAIEDRQPSNCCEAASPSVAGAVLTGLTDVMSQRRSRGADAEAVSLVKQHAADMATLNKAAERDCCLM